MQIRVCIRDRDLTTLLNTTSSHNFACNDDGAETRVHFLNSNHKGCICEKLSQKGSKSKKTVEVQVV
jgi:hypothetical protein